MAYSHPGGIVRRRYLEPLNLTLSTVAKAMGVSVSSLSRVVSEKADISSDMALRFSHVLGGTAEMWLALQAAHNLAEARKTLNLEPLEILNKKKKKFQLDSSLL